MNADETIRQIGNVTLRGIGARDLLTGDDFLSFKISRGHRRVTVRLDPSDTYSVTTHMIRSGKVAYSAENVYCDQLAEIVWQAHLER